MNASHVRKKTLLGLVAVLAFGTFAAPSITLNRVAQRYPWNGLVDIDYTIADVGDPDYYSVSLSFSADGNTKEMTTFTGGGGGN